MSDQRRARLRDWLASDECRLHPLTYPQRELWETSVVPPSDPAHHINCVIHVQGVITLRNSVAAVQRVLERQEALRISFLPGKDGLLQMIRSRSEPNLRFRTLRSAESTPEGVEEIASEAFGQPFDLLLGPLYRMEVLSRSSDSHVFVLSIHHAIADGWTLGVLVRDLCAGYLQGMMDIQEPLPEVPLSYTAWGESERAFWEPAEIESRAAFWRSVLEDAQPLWSSPTTLIPLQRWVSQLPASLASGARDLARRTGSTLFNTLLAIFQIVVAKRTGSQDIIVGTPVANRTRKSVHETMGYFSGIVPIRGQVDDTCPFADALRAVHQQSVNCFANAIPFAALVQVLGCSRSTEEHPVFQVRFALQNHPVPDVAVPGLSAQLRMRSSGTPRFDLGCEITERGDVMEVVWLFRSNLFSADDIREADRLFQKLLANACRAPESKIATLTSD